MAIDRVLKVNGWLVHVSVYRNIFGESTVGMAMGEKWDKK